MITFPANCLRYREDYTITATVSNKEVEGIIPNSESIDIRTGKRPVINEITVSPGTGVMYETEFTITLGGYGYGDDKATKDPLNEAQSGFTYLLFAVLADDPDPYRELQITTTKTPLMFISTVIEDDLPELIAIKTQIFDPNGETTTIKAPV